MIDRKHGEKSNETKAVQPKRDEEQQPDKKPSEAPSRFSANRAQPEDIQALQRSVGNRAVQRLIQTSGDVVQRSFTDDPAYRTWRNQMRSLLVPMTNSMGEVRAHHDSEGASLNNLFTRNNAAVGMLNEALAGEGGGSGGGTSATSPSGASEESESPTAGGRGESQSPQGGEDIYEGGGGTQST